MKHGPECSGGSLEMLAHPVLQQELKFLVIDVHSLYLTKLPADEKHLVLSYVWGDFKIPLTLVSNNEGYKKPRELNRDIIPKTILDAIDVVMALGLKSYGLTRSALSKIINEAEINRSHGRCLHARFSVHSCLDWLQCKRRLSGWSVESDRVGKISTRIIQPNMRLGCFPTSTEN